MMKLQFCLLSALLALAIHETQGYLPTVCYPRGSELTPQDGDTDFQCSPDGCNGCGMCSCEGGELKARGPCTLMGCMEYVESCQEYKDSSWYHFAQWERENNGDGGDDAPMTFNCKDDCNYCDGCTCDGQGNLVPGGECTQLQCN